MPFYIRKSLRFGPLRFNLSKSGVGVSAGVKGFRIGTSPRGNYVHMGRGGLYYRTSIPSVSQGRRSGSTTSLDPAGRLPPPLPSGADVAMREIDSGEVSRIVDSSSHALVQELREKRRKFRFSRMGLAVGIVFSLLAITAPRSQFTLPVILLSIGLFWVLHVFDARRKTTVIFYDLADDSVDLFRRLHDAFSGLASAKRLWHIPSEGHVRDSKYHAGADTLVKRELTAVRFDSPPFVRTNIPTPSLRVGAQSLYFFPDRVLIFDGSDIGGLAYDSLCIDIATTRFIEEQGVPSDARTVGQTWRYVNKKGGPDRRFANNPTIPVAEYESVRLTSRSGLNEALQVSRVGSFARILDAVRQIAAYLEAHKDAETVSPAESPVSGAAVEAEAPADAGPAGRDWLPYAAVTMAVACSILLLFAYARPEPVSRGGTSLEAGARSSPITTASAAAPVVATVPSEAGSGAALEAPASESSVLPPEPPVVSPPAPPPVVRFSEDTPLPATVILSQTLMLVSRQHGAVGLGKGQHVTVSARSGSKITVVSDGLAFEIDARELADAVVQPHVESSQSK